MAVDVITSRVTCSPYTFYKLYDCNKKLISCGHVRVRSLTICLNIQQIIYYLFTTPGQGGNQLEARFDKTYEPYHFGDLCPRKRGWHNIWLNMVQLFFSKFFFI